MSQAASRRMVPRGRRPALARCAAVQLAMAALIAVLAWRHPLAVLWALALPLALACWIDFPLTQSEHYGIAVLPASQRRDAAGELANDIVLPAGLGWLMLHRSLHRVHHRQPGRPWSEAPRALRDGPAPMSYAAFVRRWWAGGPRLWPPTLPASPGTQA